MNEDELIDRAVGLGVALKAMANRRSTEDDTPFDYYYDTVVALIGALHRCWTKEE